MGQMGQMGPKIIIWACQAYQGGLEAICFWNQNACHACHVGHKDLVLEFCDKNTKNKYKEESRWYFLYTLDQNKDLLHDKNIVA